MICIICEKEITKNLRNTCDECEKKVEKLSQELLQVRKKIDFTKLKKQELEYNQF